LISLKAEVPPVTPLLGEAHLWAVNVAEPPISWPLLQGILSDEERRSAARFRFRADQKRSVLGRSVLRLMLGRYLGEEPDRLVLSRSEHGKPYLAGERPGEVEFNVSHAGGWVVVGLTRAGSIGVDIEEIRDVPGAEDIAARYFAREEGLALRALPAADRREGFLACWTCKEAYVKALGTGLGTGLGSFAVQGFAGAPSLLRIGAGQPIAAEEWTMWSGAPAPGYLAATAVARRSVKVRANLWTASSGVRPWHSATD
jgi:4'-phosphopantetheinyl transferase